MSEEPTTIVNNENYKAFREKLLRMHHSHTGLKIKWRNRPYVREEEDTGEGGSALLRHPLFADQPEGITDEDTSMAIEPVDNEEAQDLAKELINDYQKQLAQQLGHTASSAPTMHRY